MIGFMPGSQLGALHHRTKRALVTRRRRPGSRRSDRRVETMVVGRLDEAARWVEKHGGGGKVVSAGSSGGSGWAQTRIVSTESGKKFFVKTAPRPAETMFSGEAAGLQAMHATHKILVPKVHHCGDFKESSGSFIVMEYLEMSGGFDQAQLGRSLAEMHLAEPRAPEARAGKFGFPMNNTIGGTVQPNEWTDNYVDFLRDKRIGHQLRLARNPTLTAMGKKLMDNLESFFEGIEVKPCILHGDLWSGNIGGVNGAPAIFDPACYYGHHEAEFGMSWCAGFSKKFWEAYFEVIPPVPGFDQRKKIYLLYHYLNHYNLFGGGYLGSCQSLLSDLVGKQGATTPSFDRDYEL